MRIPVRGWAASTLEAYAEEDWSEDDPSLEAVCAAFRRGGGRALVVDHAGVDQVLDGLTTLSNTEDARAEDKNARRSDPEGTRFARWASNGLSRLSTQLCRAALRARGARAIGTAEEVG